MQKRQTSPLRAGKATTRLQHHNLDGSPDCFCSQNCSMLIIFKCSSLFSSAKAGKRLYQQCKPKECFYFWKTSGSSNWSFSAVRISGLSQWWMLGAVFLTVTATILMGQDESIKEGTLGGSVSSLFHFPRKNNIISVWKSAAATLT